MYTTLNQIRTFDPCPEGWAKLLRHLGKTKPDDAPLPITTILESNGLDDALWCLRSLTGYEREVRLLAVSFAREVQHLMTDPRSLAALEVATAFANGQASVQDLDAARLAALAVAHEAENLSAVVSCAGYTAYVATSTFDAAYTAREAAGAEATYVAASTGAATAAVYAAHEAREALATAAAAHVVASCAAYAAAYTTLEVAGDEAAYAVALEASTAEAALAAAAALANNDHYAVRAPAIASAKDRQRNLLLEALKGT